MYLPLPRMTAKEETQGAFCGGGGYRQEKYETDRVKPTSVTKQIPKPNEEEGLGIKWPAQQADMEELKKYFEEVKARM